MTYPQEPEQLTIADEIPTLIWRGSEEEPSPAVIFLGGGTQTKWDVDQHVRELVAASGVTLVSIDMHLHGERMPPGFEWEVPIAARDVFTSIEQTARDLFRVIDALSEDPLIDESRIGLRGFSHSGHIVTVAMGMGVPVRACLSIAGGGDLTAGLAFLLHRHETPSEEISAQLTGLQADLMRINPLYHVDAFAARPIMMVHGLYDVLADFSGHFALYQALLPFYWGQPSDCIFLAHAGGHDPPLAVEEMALNWLIQQLAPKIRP